MCLLVKNKEKTPRLAGGAIFITYIQCMALPTVWLGRGGRAVWALILGKPVGILPLLSACYAISAFWTILAAVLFAAL